MKSAGKILIVDDEHTSVRALSYLLADAGYEVEGATSSSEALDIASRFEPDVLLTDILLGESQTGVDLAHQLRERHREVIVILMTGLVDREYEHWREDEGIFDIVRKPLVLDELGETISRALSEA